MRHLNYNHLLYFWTVAREGSIALASRQLNLTPQTISGQIKLLEQAVGEPLFHRVGRGLELSDTGQMVKHYADEIFSIGAELAQQVNEKQPNSSILVNIGVVDSIPKLIAFRVLEPVLSLDSPVRLVCQEGSLESLLAELALHRMDMVLSNKPLPSGLGVKAYNHSLGSSEMGWFVQKKQARKYTKRFPESLADAPFLLPRQDNVIRRELDAWLENMGIVPRVVAEFDDGALLKVFGEAGTGIFPAPSAIAEEIEHMYNASLIGVAGGVTENYFAISLERKLKNSAVVTINEVAHKWLDS